MLAAQVALSADQKPPAGKAMLNLDLGYAPKVLEFADIKLMNYAVR